MTTFVTQTALGLALKCLPPALAPIAAGIALHENPKLDMQAVNHNANGTRDYGLAQINSANFGWLSVSMHTPVNERTIFDPCINLQASMRVLFAKYNGDPPDVVKAAYAADVMAKIPASAEPPSEKQQVDPDDPQPPAWDMEAVADWRRRHAPTPEDAALAPPSRARSPADEPAIAELVTKRSQ
jgi:hypothetical protein